MIGQSGVSPFEHSDEMACSVRYSSFKSAIFSATEPKCSPEGACDAISDFDEAIAVINRTKGLFAEDFSKDDPEWTRETTAFRNALIALDCHAAGLTHFDTACVIYGQQAAEEAWSDTGRAMKDEMKRALTRGRELRDGGYRQLLKPERV